MNSILKQIIPSLWLAASFVFPAAVSAQSVTPSQIQQINSGLFRSNSQDFFQQGNRQLEREIAALLGKTATSEGKILEIDERLLSRLCREDFQINSPHSDTISAADVSSFQAKLKEVCREN
ncbi:MAG: hypothetical protein JGK17_28590 [Microcoleus sp. PH2017_10_PVI_O_A]|uniref:hypothetical protein n=1 Tax=unclassified Microcoleus TaxID=2642155 RepID=UPI001DB9D951|nr:MULTISPECIES: hypothetical protein [unclassified Microcoleus]TAE75621.1 MAG: hypothetical protein EAZ83_29105 [Oscillatoriales cyanobacterium]MCC3409442.1 hypothetical protein [Microcoleus sp. PH2017_10_PVI_O_A]MCC3463705.1 hypothetical protein [Microcoleus sp. PH2017_11_PCY_U_A]MCC3482065.1 hypothetical protein [Microcoleus sp. PH2017_12_PCY_D_A]MCC3563041.1 hypothetical protein [Microcoleus sp. PH2017_27_LUM_O_A]